MADNTAPNVSAVSVCATSLVKPVESMSELAFPRSCRLLTPSDYSVVFKRNKRLTDRYWTLLAHRSQSPTPRLGLAIAKKRAKRAVDRNRIKRVAREAFRHAQADLAGFQLVIMNRDASASASAQELRHSLDVLLGKLSRH